MPCGVNEGAERDRQADRQTDSQTEKWCHVPCRWPKEVLFEAEPLALVQWEDIRDPWLKEEGTLNSPALASLAQAAAHNQEIR